MASTNQSPQYQKAEAMFLLSKSNEEKLRWLEEMIRQCPKHKSSEKMLANLKTRYVKLKEKIETLKKSSKRAGKSGIKKEEMQAVIIGFTNSGKSSLLSALTNAAPIVSPHDFTTKQPIVGMMPFSGIQIQIVEVPAIESEYYDKGIVNSADSIILLVNSLDEIDKINNETSFLQQKKIIAFNNKNNLDERKVEATLKSKRLDYVLINLKMGLDEEENYNMGLLKEKIFQSFNKIRVYTKNPAQKAHSDKPLILNKGSTVKDVAEKILHGFSKHVKETFVTGPSSKFPHQKVGITHALKDMDIVEFKTR